MNYLFIVESPNKCAKIQGYLDEIYGANNSKVVASVGHFRDLPAKELGVNRQRNFELTYLNDPDKTSIVTRLKSLAAQVGSSNVYLATDPDREGEAISMHLATVLGIPFEKTKRIAFHEITKTAVQKAIQEARVIDMNLVRAQEARRAIDRLAGYEISDMLRRKTGEPLTAGRVQSVALRLVVDRERAINSFASNFKYLLKGTFLTPLNERFIGSYHTTFPDEASVLAYLRGSANKVFSVSNVEVKTVEQHPQPPFTTSTMQQDAIRKLSGSSGRWSSKKVMDVAQELFAKGHITYMRTDSPNLSSEAISAIQQQLTNTIGNKYFHHRVFKAKESAQEAHEAIRPTHFETKKAGDTPDEQALYQLIYTRAMASQMKPALFDQTIISVTSQQPEDLYIAKAKVQKFDGYLAVYADVVEEGSAEEDESASLSKISTGDPLKTEQLVARKTYSSPPKRFDEAGLVKDLETRGIGRPSTYASIMSNIVKREYITTQTIQAKKVPVTIFTLKAGQLTKREDTQSIGGDKNKMIPTEKGEILIKYLEKQFAPVIDYTFTAGMENKLDAITEAQTNYFQVVGAFDKEHRALLERAETASPDAERKAKTREVGTLRGKPVKTGIGKFGTYILFDEKFYKAEAYAPEDITIELADKLITEGQQKTEENSKNLIHKAGIYSVKRGTFGLYVTDGTTNAKLPPTITEDEQIKKLTAGDLKTIITNYLNWKKSQDGKSSKSKASSGNKK